MSSTGQHLNSDVLVIGSGLPGAIMALVLARLGLDVIVIDRSGHPRFAIGESSTPTTDAYLARIAAEFDLPELAPLATYPTARAAYPELTIGRKRGFSFFRHRAGKFFDPGEDHANEMVVAASPSDELSDSNWLRSDVDNFVVSLFPKYGVRFFDHCEMLALKKTPSGWEVELRHDRSVPPSRTLRCRYLVDASGGAAIGVRHLGGQSRLGQLWTDTSAVFAHFEMLPRWSEILSAEQQVDHPFRCDDAAVHHLIDAGWMWQLRFCTGLTSCGIVRANGGALDASGGATDPTAAYDHFRAIIAQYPTLADQFLKARAVTPSEGAYFRPRLQHFWSPGSGPGWCALPHTIGFVDPLFSKGLAHAFSGVYRIGRRVRAGDANFSPRFDAEMTELAAVFAEEVIYLDRLIASCYFCLDDFERFRLATLWYFAAATQFEHVVGTSQNLDRPFLFSEDHEFRRRLFEFSDHCHQVKTSGDIPLDSTRHLTETGLEPFDRVGLFAPPRPNMYGATAAPAGTKSVRS